jgi:LDH2 family malate/lactate/ureidoglycolate dehydrogenase
MAAMLTATAGEPGVRLPGDRRLASREKLRVEGIQIAPELHAQLVKLAESGVTP